MQNSSCCRTPPVAVIKKCTCFLFLLVIDFVMWNGVNGVNLGIARSEQSRLTDLVFVDDISLLAENRDVLQELTTNLKVKGRKVCLRISGEKTKTMQDGSTLAVLFLH